MSVYKLATTTIIDVAMLSSTTTTTTTTHETTPSPGESTSPGAVAGIAIGTVIGLAALLTTVLLCVKWRRRRRHYPHRGDKRATIITPQLEYHLQPQQSRGGETTGDAASSLFRSTTETSNESWTTTTSATASSPYFPTASSLGEERVTIGDATMVDLKRLSGIVVDAAAGRSAPRRGVYALQDARGCTTKAVSYIDGHIRQIDVAATGSATTGAQWRHTTQNLPLTPRTPRTTRSDYSEEEGNNNTREDEEGQRDEDEGGPISPLASSSSCVVRAPAHIARHHGLGDRAWHRRRLSVPFLPRGGQTSETSSWLSMPCLPSGGRRPTETSLDDDMLYFAGGGSGSCRYMYNDKPASGRSSPNWRPVTGGVLATSCSVAGDVARFCEEQQRHVVGEGEGGDLTQVDGPPWTPRSPLERSVEDVRRVTRMYDQDDQDDDDDDDGPALSPRWFWTVRDMAKFSDQGGGQQDKEKTAKVD